jgi:hypothetical protein
MRRYVARGLGGLLALLLLVPLWGCDLKSLNVIIPDFDTAAVQGVRVWRLDDATNDPVARGRLDFSAPYTVDGNEVVDYTQVNPDGTRSATYFAEVRRDVSGGSSAHVILYYDRLDQPGWFKVSTFNSQGDSALSLAQTFL